MIKNIVVADDFDNTLWVIDFTLKRLKCEILKASNGKEALAYFDGRKIDLLITDLNMPEMNGIELIEAVKVKPEYRTIPIIVLSTEKDAEKKQATLELNITTWVQKPFQNEVFFKIVKKCLQID